MAGSTDVAALKRKTPSETLPAHSARKRSKVHDTRSISTQSADAALSGSKELNVASYIKAREYEIKSLEKSMQKARKRLTQRAFQQVPRHMRRRTASHNVKKVPRRLRTRAEREMKDDNTPTATKRTRTPSRKLRIRMENVKLLRKLNQGTKTVRQRKRDAKAKTNTSDPQDHVLISRVPRLKKNTVAQPPMATSKYKRRQVNKTWLPTHMWHTKRAHMTPPTTPLWRMAIPLSPTEKSYRPSHRAAGNRGCIAWDTSFMSTISCIGTDETLEKLLRGFQFHGEGWSGNKHAKWKRGSRFAEGWLHERDNDKQIIAPVQVLWLVSGNQTENSAKDPQSSTNVPLVEGEIIFMRTTPEKPTHYKRSKLNRQLFIRVHPSAFHQLWLEVLKVAKMQKPQVLVEDLRFEIGSIEVVGSGGTEALIGVLDPENSGPTSITSSAQIWRSLTTMTNPATLPMNSVLAFDIVDPRLHHPPTTVRIENCQQALSHLDELLVSWPLDSLLEHSKLESHKVRWMASNCLASQKAINRRRATVTPSQPLRPLEKDPKIPIVLLASRPSPIPSSKQGKWIVMMPWGCVDAVWRSLMYYPLSSGGTPRFGGLEQDQQVAFEQERPWFPGDLPGTEAGKAWDRTQNVKRFDEWVRKPPSRRLAWDTVDIGLDRRGELGRGWACDWEFLFRSTSQENASRPTTDAVRGVFSASPGLISQERLLTQRQRKAAKVQAEAATESARQRRNTSSPESDDDSIQQRENLTEVQYFQLPPSNALSFLKLYKTCSLPSETSLFTVRITLLTRGTPSPTARVYRIPRSKPTAISSKTAKFPPAQPSSETLPAAQPQPSTNSNTSTQPYSSSTLRERWLALDPQTSNPHLKSQPLKALKPNRSNLPKSNYYLPPENLDHIIALPPNAHPETIKKYTLPPNPRTDTSISTRAEIVQTALESDLWSNDRKHEHVPCPDVEDLIGFVTTGGYNLAQGRGTAVASLWLQRVIQGWKEEDESEVKSRTGLDIGSGNVGEMNNTQSKSRTSQQNNPRNSNGSTSRNNRKERERRLCIVRNSGESIGRLAIWELCE